MYFFKKVFLFNTAFKQNSISVYCLLFHIKIYGLELSDVEEGLIQYTNFKIKAKTTEYSDSTHRKLYEKEKQDHYVQVWFCPDTLCLSFTMALKLHYTGEL